MRQTERKEDRRVIKTKRAIRNAFVNLLVQKDMEKITIKELALLADVDRKTIYNYYEGIGDILDELENEMILDFQKEAFTLIGESRPQAYFDAITRLLSRNLELYGLLLRGNNINLVTKMALFLHAWIEETVNRSEKIPQEKVSLFCEYITSGIVSAYRYWFLSEPKIPLEEFSKQVCTLVMGGMDAYLQ